MKNLDWDIYRCFMSVARTGGLTGAAQTLGSSAATVGRRMLELEERTGRALFLRSQTGYQLTGDGELLFEQLQEMEAAARRVESWRREGEGATVRITVGTWIAWLLAENFPALCSERDGFSLAINVGETRASLAYRETDIGIRAFEPEETYLAASPVGDVAYAAYRQKNAPSAVSSRWVAVGEEEAISSYLRWPHQQADGRIVATITRPRSLLDLARAGAGCAVLPCFVGDLDPMLERAGEEISALRHRQWIVMNNEDRHRREIRTVVDRMTKLLRSHADVFAGKRPRRG
ncbi:LysR family transcriptional regulator [Ensifer adhaerens]|uniref:LysR family transcriptional regulator n=1 Tax=Ensifer adhaerens TaxID=106592 RepID=UPI001CBF6408|nr:LysR family transcriptional regulator [Ensifer adhaerens]MBZ7920486.1 LysR family transcriptional regulator [Ensifer adhaerens]UAX92967.1 LysR family transcriptional regulator [Ensifer adhaerens]UAY00602.1 LysR family transcriptional regulator [Ensifer adhaerens]UAY07983.1 LysR family transcriptional regulator [Ensifer adhaerens]